LTAAEAVGARDCVVDLVQEDGAIVVCEHCAIAENPYTRFRGLLGRRELPPDHGLLIRPAGSVHSCFMRFPIDVVFLDAQLEVIGVVERLRPWRVAARRGARSVLELAPGECARRGISPGKRLRLRRDS
jgi:uncharacterized membrane protein (UPF0127 family)